MVCCGGMTAFVVFVAAVVVVLEMEEEDKTKEQEAGQRGRSVNNQTPSCILDQTP